jgi:hypothetical protein
MNNLPDTILSQIFDYFDYLAPNKCFFYYKIFNLEHLQLSALFKNLCLDCSKVTSVDKLLLLPNKLLELELETCGVQPTPDEIIIEILKWIPSTVKLLDISRLKTKSKISLINFINPSTHPNLTHVHYCDSQAPFYSPLNVSIFWSGINAVEEITDVIGLENTSDNVHLDIFVDKDILGHNNVIGKIQLQKHYPLARYMDIYFITHPEDLTFETAQNLESIDIEDSYWDDDWEKCDSGTDYCILKVTSPIIEKIYVNRFTKLVFCPETKFNKPISLTIYHPDNLITTSNNVTSLEIAHCVLKSNGPRLGELFALLPNISSFKMTYRYENVTNVVDNKKMDWVKYLPENLRHLDIFVESQGRDYISSTNYLDPSDLKYFIKRLPQNLLSFRFSVRYNAHCDRDGFKPSLCLTQTLAKHLPRNLEKLSVVQLNTFNKEILCALPKSLTHLDAKNISKQISLLAFKYLPNLKYCPVNA